MIEVILSLSIISIIILPFTQLFITSTKANNVSKREIQAVYLAQKYMEKVKGREIQTDDVLQEQGFKIEIIFNLSTSNKNGVVIRDESVSVRDADLNLSISNNIDTLFRLSYGKNPIYNRTYAEDQDIEMNFISTDKNGIFLEINDLISSQKNMGFYTINSFQNQHYLVIHAKIQDEGNRVRTTGLHVKNKSTRQVCIYKYDDWNNKLQIYAKGGEVQVVSNLASNEATKYINEEALYEVSVVVSYHDKIYHKIVSQIRK